MSESTAQSAVVSDAVWRDALAHAILAPSSHNSQPWLFRIDGDAVELHCDRRRRLPVVDPQDRELIISCGAALMNLRLALCHAGFDADVAAFPDPADPDLLARISVQGPCTCPGAERRLYAAIANRRTCRYAFDNTPLPDRLLQDCAAAVSREGAWLRIVRDGDDLTQFGTLVTHADHYQSERAPFRRELARWLRSNDDDVEDGMPGYALGLGDLGARVAPLIVRTFDLGDGRAAADLELVRHSAAIGVLGCATDTPGDWLKTGQALERMALTLTARGVAMSYLNQPVEVAASRDALARLVGEDQPAQLVVRLGFGPLVPPTPRRPVSDVLI